MAEHSLGHARESQQALDEAIAKTATDVAYQIAQAYAWCGEEDKAFEWLDRAYRQRDGGLTELKTDPLVVALRSDPRFKAMLEKINLPARWRRPGRACPGADVREGPVGVDGSPRRIIATCER